MSTQVAGSNLNLFISSEEFFTEMIDRAFSDRKLTASKPVRGYLVELLQFYLDARNLFDEEKVDESGKRKPQTLAEIYLVAHQSEPALKMDLLKKLGDRTLYISGFFSDSLQRKIVDVDYYVDMGGAAYASLAQITREDTKAYIFHTFAERFGDFVDVLSVLSRNAQIQSNQNILRMYERYIKTGSELDRDKLTEMGLLTAGSENLRKLPYT